MVLQAAGGFMVTWVITQVTTRMNIVGQLPEELYHLTMFIVFLAPMLLFGWLTSLFCILGIVTAYFNVYKH